MPGYRWSKTVAPSGSTPSASVIGPSASVIGPSAADATRPGSPSGAAPPTPSPPISGGTSPNDLAEDTDDWAAADAAAAQDIALVSRDLAELANVEAALARLADGTYGECEDCGNPIPYPRLAAYPAARRCVACQELWERRERARK